MAGKNNHSPWSLPFCLCSWHITNPLSVTSDCLLSKCSDPFGADYHCETNYQKCSARVKWVFQAECFTPQIFSQLNDTCKLTQIEEMRHSNCYCLLSVSFSSLVSSWHLLCDGSALKSGLYVGGWCAGEFLLWSTLSLWQMHPREIGWCPGALTCQRVCMRPVALETKVPPNRCAEWKVRR